METLILLFAILLLLSGVAYWAMARHRFVKYVASNYPGIWWELCASNAAAEVSGFSPELTRWVVTKRYEELGNPRLSGLALSYQRSKYLCLLGVFIGILVVVGLSHAGS